MIGIRSKTAIAVFSALMAGALFASPLRAQGHPGPDFTRVAAPMAADDGHSLKVQGDAEAVRIEAHRATIADALLALGGTFNIRYRSAITLNEALNGTYAGSLPEVLSRILRNYDYVVKYENAAVDVTIIGRRGGPVTVPSPLATVPTVPAAPATAAPTALTPPVPTPSKAPIRHGRCACPPGWPPTFATRLVKQNRCSCPS